MFRNFVILSLTSLALVSVVAVASDNKASYFVNGGISNFRISEAQPPIPYVQPTNWICGADFILELPQHAQPYHVLMYFGNLWDQPLG